MRLRDPSPVTHIIAIALCASFGLSAAARASSGGSAKLNCRSGRAVSRHGGIRAFVIARFEAPRSREGSEYKTSYVCRPGWILTRSRSTTRPSNGARRRACPSRSPASCSPERHGFGRPKCEVPIGRLPGEQVRGHDGAVVERLTRGHVRTRSLGERASQPSQKQGD